MMMFFKSYQQSKSMNMQQASQYKIFSTFEETVLLFLSIKVRPLISGRISLFLSSQSNNWEACLATIHVQYFFLIASSTVT